MNTLEAGKKAPQFTLEGTGGNWSLSDGAGGAVVIYFYPRDNTPGCTQEGEAFAAAYPQFKKAKAAIVGISADSLAAHKFLGIERSTFLIDGKGVLRHEWRKVKVNGHAAEVLAAVKAL